VAAGQKSGGQQKKGPMMETTVETIARHLGHISDCLWAMLDDQGRNMYSELQSARRKMQELEGGNGQPNP